MSAPARRGQRDGGVASAPARHSRLGADRACETDGVARPPAARMPLVALLALVALACAAAPTSALAAGGGAAPGPAVVLQRTTLVQSGVTLRWAVRTGAAWPARHLRGKGRRQLCLLVSQTAAAPGHAGLCVDAFRNGRLVLKRTRFTVDGRRVGGGRVRGATVTVRGRTLHARFAMQAAGLRPGALAWRADATAVDGDCRAVTEGLHSLAAPAAATVSPAGDSGGAAGPQDGSGATGASGPTGPAGPAPGSLSCRSTLPRRASFHLRLRAPKLVGCRAAGADYHRNGPTNRRAVGLSFDDGPSTYTPQVLSILRRYRVHATFFQIGQQVGGNAKIERQILAQGSELGNHSWSHPSLAGGGSFAYGQLHSTIVAIRKASGYTPCLFRPPYGAHSNALFSIARSLGMLTIEWDVDPQDWSRPGTSTIVSRVLGQTRPGSIILMHDGGGPRDQTVAALPTILSTLKRRGYTIEPVSQLLGLAPIYR